MKYLFLLLFCPTFVYSQVQVGGDIDGEAADDHSGFVVSSSSDGKIVAIGGPFNDGSFENAGHVRVYEFKIGAWTQLGGDIDGEAEGDKLGTSVSLSSDGTIVAIGGKENDGSFENAGHVQVYKFESDVWTQLGDDIDGEAEGDQFGYSVSLSSDGTILAIGSRGNDDGGFGAGHVRVYKFESDVWTQLGDDIDGEAELNWSGKSISLSSDGSILAVGAQGNNGGSFEAGCVKVYVYELGVWTQLGENINGEAEGDLSGTSVSLSSDGSLVAIGAIGNDDSFENAGHVRVYKFEADVWTQIGGDIDGEAIGDESGTSVRLSSDGDIVAIGTNRSDDAGPEAGHVRVYVYQSGVWTQLGEDIDGESGYDNSGRDIGLSSDGSIVVIGALGNDGGGSLSGHARVYDFSLLLSADSFQQDYFSFYPNPVKDVLNITINKGIELIQVNVYNALGQSIFSTKKQEIKTSDLEPGVYFVEIETAQGKSAKKVVVD